MDVLRSLTPFDWQKRRNLGAYSEVQHGGDHFELQWMQQPSNRDRSNTDQEDRYVVGLSLGIELCKGRQVAGILDVLRQFPAS